MTTMSVVRVENREPTLQPIRRARIAGRHRALMGVVLIGRRLKNLWLRGWRAARSGLAVTEAARSNRRVLLGRPRAVRQDSPSGPTLQGSSRHLGQSYHPRQSARYTELLRLRRRSDR